MESENDKDLTEPNNYLFEALKVGVDSDNFQLRNWAYGLTKEIGFFMLVLVECQADLPDNLQQAYPAALKNHYTDMPSWQRYDISAILDRDLQTLPADVLETVKPHTYRSIKPR